MSPDTKKTCRAVSDAAFGRAQGEIHGDGAARSMAALQFGTDAGTTILIRQALHRCDRLLELLSATPIAAAQPATVQVPAWRRLSENLLRIPGRLILDLQAAGSMAVNWAMAEEVSHPAMADALLCPIMLATTGNQEPAARRIRLAEGEGSFICFLIVSREGDDHVRLALEIEAPDSAVCGRSRAQLWQHGGVVEAIPVCPGQRAVIGHLLASGSYTLRIVGANHDTHEIQLYIS